MKVPLTQRFRVHLRRAHLPIVASRQLIQFGSQDGVQHGQLRAGRTSTLSRSCARISGADETRQQSSTECGRTTTPMVDSLSHKSIKVIHELAVTNDSFKSNAPIDRTSRRTCSRRDQLSECGWLLATELCTKPQVLYKEIGRHIIAHS
jgi:hypothetical protein